MTPTPNWIEEKMKIYDEHFPVVFELVPLEYIEYLREKGQMTVLIEMENDRRAKYAQNRFEQIRKFLSTALKEQEGRIKQEVSDELYKILPTGQVDAWSLIKSIEAYRRVLIKTIK